VKIPKEIQIPAIVFGLLAVLLGGLSIILFIMFPDR
jgi:hypothetical protein